MYYNLILKIMHLEPTEVQAQYRSMPKMVFSWYVCTITHIFYILLIIILSVSYMKNKPISILHHNKNKIIIKPKMNPLPIMATNTKRTFPKLKIIKNYLRSQICQIHLVGQITLSIEKDVLNK